MNSRNLLLIGFFLSALIPLNLPAEPPALIKVDLDKKIADVDPNIYGGFLEPIRTVVNGTIYDPKSPLADTNGFRTDFIQLVKDLHIPIVRWPGGNYVSGYNWEDGIGPKELRPVRLDLAWNQIDRNQMGTDEYAKFCSLIGAENFVCINAGLGTLDQARYWIEYCNYPKGTWYSDLRRKYGNEQPFNVKYWSLGNEIDGPWQLGQKNAEDYCKFALEAAKAMRLVDRNAKFIADAASNYQPDNKWIEWNNYVLQQMVGQIDYFSVHRYIRNVLNGDTNYADVVSTGLEIDQKADAIKTQIAKAMAKSRSQRPVYISFDEWSPGIQRSGPTLTGSLLVAEHLNSFIRHADIVKIATITMLSSLVGTSPDGDYKNTLYLPFYLYSNNARGTALDVRAECEKYSNKFFHDIPYLDISAVFNDTGKMLVVNVVNRHESNAITSEIELRNGKFTGSASVHEVNGASVAATNTRTDQAVAIATKQIEFSGDHITYSFPAHSFTQLLIPVQ